MLPLVVHLLVTGASVLLVTAVLPGAKAKSYSAAVLFACAVAIANAVTWHYLGGSQGPLPRGVSAGVGSVVVNAFAFWVAGKVVPGIELSGCITAGLVSLGVTFVNGVLEVVVRSFLPKGM